MLENAAILLLSPSKKKLKQESYENIETQEDILEEEEKWVKPVLATKLFILPWDITDSLHLSSYLAPPFPLPT